MMLRRLRGTGLRYGLFVVGNGGILEAIFAYFPRFEPDLRFKSNHTPGHEPKALHFQHRTGYGHRFTDGDAYIDVITWLYDRRIASLGYQNPRKLMEIEGTWMNMIDLCRF